MKKAYKILNEYFGYKEFRNNQDKIIEAALNKIDSLVIMPTGGGKSLCYQIPAMVFDGLTIVVSPLISLMADQVMQLLEIGIPAVLLNSSISFDQYRENYNYVLNGKAKLLYLAPETLMSGRIQELLSKVDVSMIAIDEAHCISEWGHDFRPEYRDMTSVLKKYTNAVTIALTATATPRVREDIISALSMKNKQEYISSFDRENLFIEIIKKSQPTDQVVNFLKKFPDRSGIIYCFSRKQVDELTEDLKDEGFSVLPYHAGLTSQQRSENQEKFIRDDVQIIVATIAFGMGINKPDVRFVIHYDLPKNIESYYQQIGRAGRDGLRAHCLLLYSGADIGKIKFILQDKPEFEKKIAQSQLNQIKRFAESYSCRRVPLLGYFGEDYPKKNCGMCDNCLTIPRELSDITIPAQKFLSCVKRSGEMHNSQYIIDILRGSNSARIVGNGHDSLSTWGIGKEYSSAIWDNLSRQFLEMDLMTLNDDGNLALTEKAWRVFRGQELVMGQLRIPVKKSIERVKKTKVDIEYDEELFAILRSLRKYIADKRQIPPYAVFSDRTLTELAFYKPVKTSEFLEIYGVGIKKMSSFGGQFLKEIQKYEKENASEKHFANDAQGSKPHVTRGKSYIKTGEMVKNGLSLEEVAGVRKLKLSTVLDHLYIYLQEGNSFSSGAVEALIETSGDELTGILDNFEKLGTEYLRAVHNELNGKYDYDELKKIRIYYMALCNE